MQEQQFKQIIAQAMYAGSLLAEQNYSGEINNQAHEPLVASFRKLKDLIGEFTEQNGLNQINPASILPLQKEIDIIKNLSL